MLGVLRAKRETECRGMTGGLDWTAGRRQAAAADPIARQARRGKARPGQARPSHPRAPSPSVSPARPSARRCSPGLPCPSLCSLYEFIKNNNFKGISLGLIRRFAIQLLQSLKFLRGERIIHCDLKPSVAIWTCNWLCTCHGGSGDGKTERSGAFDLGAARVCVRGMLISPPLRPPLMSLSAFG